MKEILDKSLNANPYMVNAMFYSLEVMATRKKKYSGNAHPYYNFCKMGLKRNYHVYKTMKPDKFVNLFPYFREELAKRTYFLVSQINMWKVFLFYILIKDTRLDASTEDFADEKFTDTLRDLVNYAAIMLGWFLFNLEVTDVLSEKEIFNEEITNTIKNEE